MKHYILYLEVLYEKEYIYSIQEEKINGILHIIGFIISVLFLPICLIKVDTIISVTALLIYCISLSIMFLMSSLYHLATKEKTKKRLQILDHCSIFLLIAGKYTPFVIIGMLSNESIIILIMVWVMALIGITLNLINMKNIIIKTISYIFYILMGWFVMFISHKIPLLNEMAFIYLLIGGIIYTAGFIFYAIGKRKKWFHCIWHIFVLLGVIMHIISIMYMIKFF